MYSLRNEMSKVIKMASLIGPDEYLNKLLVVVQKAIFSVDLQRFQNFTLVDLVTDSGYTFVWHSKSTESTCPRCGFISSTLRNTYKSRIVIDEELLGQPVMHVLRLKLYICDHCKECEEEKTSFVEDISMICRSYMKTTIALDEKIVNDAIGSSANGLARNYEGRINISGETILRRVKEAGAMVTEKRLMETKGVTALSVDDNNSRKGNPSSACTVVIDAETHNILVVAQGANSEVAKKIFDKFTEATILSRDRACSYSKAGDECSLEQIADIFHLVQNAHDAVKKGLSNELRHNIYIREGDGWVELSAKRSLAVGESPVPVCTLTEEDLTERARLAHLSERQEKKYRKVVDLLRLYDEGLSDAEISKRLGITWAESRKLLSEAGDVINNVESKIDEYLINLDNRQCRQKTISKNARPSRESIVEPYSATVMRMVSEGHTHRTIHPVIREMGFTGSANAIYQYILKKRHEESNEKADEGPAAQNDHSRVSRRPKPVSLQRIAKGNLYKYILHEVATERSPAGDKDDVTSETKAVPEKEVSKTETGAETGDSTPAISRASSLFYSDEVADIILSQTAQANEESKKN